MAVPRTSSMMLALLSLRVAQLALLPLLLLTVGGVLTASRTVAAPDAVLTFHLALTTCPTHSTHVDTASLLLPHRLPPTPPLRCTVSVRVLRHSPDPTWHAVLNQSVTPTSAPLFTYPIPATQQRCHHHVVLRCVSARSGHPLAVLPSAGFFHAPSARARRRPIDTFVVVDRVGCLQSSSSDTATSSSIRVSGFCLPDDKPSVSAVDSANEQQPPSRNLTQLDDCPVPPSTRSSSHPRRRRPQQPVCERAPSDSATAWTRLVVWLYDHSRSGQDERVTWRLLHNATEPSNELEVAYTTGALLWYRSWLFVLCGASVCSAVVVVWLIARLTKRIELDRR